MNTIRELYRGNIHPTEKSMPAESERKSLSKQLLDAERAFTQTLSDEQRQLYRRFESLLVHYRCADEESAFIEAFRLGARIMLDVITDRDFTSA